MLRSSLSMDLMASSARGESLLKRFARWAKTFLDEDEGDRPKRGRVREDATIRRTRQITQRDCGIAALSMMVDVPYPQARAALFKKGERCVGTNYPRMRKALRDFGVLGTARFRRFRSWEAITSHALVHIRWKHLPKKDPGHWVVLQKLETGYQVLDPAAYAETLATSDTSEMWGVSFVPVALVERGKKAKAATKLPKAPAQRKPTNA
jgi:ABC-type bacteriocin/lantibiotic exporter with double-glycine peptidase domain